MVKAKVYIREKPFEGLPKVGDLKIIEEDIPTLKDGEFLAEAVFLSVDPYMKMYSVIIPLGSPFIGQQVALNTAYFGLLEVGQPKAGETVVVSGAAGAVGSIAGQIAKIKGCKVIGIAGSDDKLKWLKDDLGFDGGINYKTQNVEHELNKLAPKGVDCYFDNVGGEITSAVLAQMNNLGRVALCGAISLYNDGSNKSSPYTEFAILSKQIKVEGFFVNRWDDRWNEAITQNLQWMKEGKLKYNETVTDGFENMFQAFVDMLQGGNTGKAIVKV